MSILSLQTAFPTFKNDGFILEILTFLKHPSFDLEDRFGSVLALFRAPFGSSWGYFVSSLGLRTPRSTFVVPQAERRTLRSTFGAAKDERRTLRSTFVVPRALGEQVAPCGASAPWRRLCLVSRHAVGASWGPSGRRGQAGLDLPRERFSWR